MKKLSLTLLSLLTLLACSSFTSAYALSVCMQVADTDNNLHCTIINDLPANKSQGRYIKMERYNYNDIGNIRDSIECLSADNISYYSEPESSGTYFITYSICSDALGANCETIGTDTFTVSPGWCGISYNVDSKFSAISVKSSKAAYPACQAP